MKRATTVRHYHMRRVKKGITPVRTHDMNYWASLRTKLMKKGFTKQQAGMLAIRTIGLKDSDKDGVPDVADCQPYNPNAQDWTWESANQKLSEGRSKDSKKIDNNTTLNRRGEDIAIKLHDTDVVTLKKNGDVVLDSGGWMTTTTKDRINQSLTIGHLRQEKGMWFIQMADKKYEFKDGMTISKHGDVSTPEVTPKARKAVGKTRSQVNSYADNYVDALFAGKVPKPSGGDCWHCALRDKEGKTMGEMGDAKDHIEQHMKEKYYVPSLLENAIKAYPVSVVAKDVVGRIWYDDDAAAEGAKKSFGDIAKMQLKSSLKRYLRKQMGQA